MSVSIIGCPSCRTLVLSDTIQCPKCGHVFDETQQKKLGEDAGSENVNETGGEEVACGHCHEMVRVGLVRCWNCGRFMRDDIAKMYEDMQASERPVIYSPLPEIEEEEFVASDADFDSPPREEEDDEDFEYNPDPAPMEAGTPADYYRVQQPAANATNAYPGPQGYAQQQEGAVPSGYPPQAPHQAPQPPPLPTENPTAQPAAESPEKKPPAQAPAPASEKAHSEETAGEVLLNIAMQEEKESVTRRKKRRSSPRLKGGFIVYCPHGHRIEVQDRHRGMTGRCPRCRAAFFVPLTLHEEAKKPEEQPAETAAVPAVAPGYSGWLKDVPLNKVDPTKLKLKPNSLVATAESVDVGFSSDGMLLVWLAKSGGLFSSGGDKKKESIRETLYEELQQEKKVEELSVAQNMLIPPEKIGEQMKVVQPYPYPHESMFAGVPVFGEGKIAVRIPSGEEKPNEQMYLSFFLSGFRKLAAELSARYGLKHFGEDCGVPLTDEFVEMTCHYSEWKLPVLQHVELYQADSEIKLKEIGWQCEGCQLVISEESRKKEKIGGKSSKGIAKAKCPKCQQKFGYHPLLTLEDISVGEAASTTT